MPKRNSGFTLIELTIVIAILVIFMAITVPVYQRYTIRAKVSEGIDGTAWARTAVAETLQKTGEVPAHAATSFSQTVQTEYVDSIRIAGDGSGAITVTTRDTGANPDVVVTFTPTMVNGEPVSWGCSLDRGKPVFVPPACRN